MSPAPCLPLGLLYRVAPWGGGRRRGGRSCFAHGEPPLNPSPQTQRPPSQARRERGPSPQAKGWRPAGGESPQVQLRHRASGQGLRRDAHTHPQRGLLRGGAQRVVAGGGAAGVCGHGRRAAEPAPGQGLRVLGRPAGPAHRTRGVRKGARGGAPVVAGPGRRGQDSPSSVPSAPGVSAPARSPPLCALRPPRHRRAVPRRHPHTTHTNQFATRCTGGRGTATQWRSRC